ncbi:hypothetical protein E2I00_007403, partial [Balaenoptera physalus]
MDTSKAQGELGWLLDPPEDGWSEVQQILNGTPLYMYQDCPVQESRDTDHWLRSNWIYRGEEASRVHVELQFTVRDCKSFPGEAGPLGCKETFNLLYMESDQDVGIQLRRPLFQKVTTVAADQSFTIRDLASGAVKLNVERCSLGHLTRRGLYLAFHNPGACVALVSVRVFYQLCPETWLVPVGRCHCEPGYEEGGGGGGVEGCLACPKGSYRADVNTPSCLKCPQHSTAESEGATMCTCESGHYRVPGEGPAAACTRESGAGAWPPVRRCRTSAKPVLGSPLRPPKPELLCFGDPALPALGAPMSGSSAGRGALPALRGKRALLPGAQRAHFGRCVQTPSGLSLRLVKKAPRQLELTWAGSRPRSPGGNLSYELHVLNQDEERYQLVLEPRVLLTELQPDTTYTVRVRMVTPLGPGPFSPDHEFRTSPPVSRVVTGGEIVAIICGLLLGVALLLGMLVFRSRKAQRRRHQRRQRQHDRVADGDREDKLWLKPYVDLQAYEDPAQGALDFTQELDPAWLVVDTVIGEGKPIMIITEFMENGALDAFLRTPNLNAACRCIEAEPQFQESPASPCVVTLRLPSLSGSDGIPYRSVAEWLESIRMKRYILHFQSAGLDTMERVLDLTAEDLAQMGITLPGHQKRILCSIQ